MHDATSVDRLHAAVQQRPAHPSHAAGEIAAQMTPPRRRVVAVRRTFVGERARTR